MSMYTYHGRFIEQDNDPPAMRRHCACGAFLPKRPTEIKREIPVKDEYIYDDDGNITGYNVLETAIEYEEEWPCKRCKRSYDAREMWG